MLEVGERLLEPIGVVDAQPVDLARLHHGLDACMRGLRHRILLSTHADQRVHVEKAAIIGQLARELPTVQFIKLRS